MALLAEEVVEEWLRRSGYFTIRGAKLGVNEIDLLAVRHRQEHGPECRHIEVQASIRPVSYISKVPRALQRSGRAANSAKRSDEELIAGVGEWIQTKFDRADKVALMARLWPAVWSRELVLHNVKAEKEVELIRGHGVSIIQLATILQDLRTSGTPISSAAGGDFIDLVHLGSSAAKPLAPPDARQPAAPSGARR
jgi:hypothetical protein